MRLFKQLLALLILVFAVNSTLWAAKWNEEPIGFKLLGADPTEEAGFGLLYGKADKDLYWLDPDGVPRNVLLGGSTQLDNLTDVTITAPSVNQVLTYDGSDWVNQDAAGGVGKWVTAFQYFIDDVIWYEPELKFYVALADHISGVFATDRDTNLYWSEVSTAEDRLKLDQTTPQSVINGAPIFDGVDFNTALANPTYGEGKLFYDNTKNAVSYFNDEADITVNLGQELLFSVCNNTGSTIANGTVVYPDPVTGIGIASNIEKDKARVIAVATHSIEDGTCGYVTKYGQVGGLNTSAFSVGDILYLNSAGGYTTTRPNDGAYAIIVGVVDVVDLTNGIITVDIIGTDLTVEVTDTNGFPLDQRTGTVMTVTGAGPYTFNIAPTGSDFHFYVLGEKFEKTSIQSVNFADSEGEHWFYFDNTGTLLTLYEPTSAQKRQIILDYAFVGYIYWNATANVIVGDIYDERHGISMSPTTHAYLHLTRGAQFINGLGLGNFVIGNGSLDTHAQFSVASGMIMDEDIAHTLAANITVGTTIPVLYLEGASTNPSLREGSQAGYAVLTAPANGRLYYNQNNAGTWQLTEVTANNDYVLYHIFAVNGQTKTVFSVMGQNQYSTAALARTGAATEISNIIVGFEMAEVVPLGTIIFQTSTAFANTPNAAVIEAVSGGADYVDWRTTDLAQGAAPTSHANLTNVESAAAGVTQGHIDDQAQTIYGAKTFNGAISASNLSGTNTGDQDVLDATQLNEVETAVDPVYIKNGGAEQALSGWDNTVGGADFKIERNTAVTPILKGAADFLITATSSATINDYIRYPFTVNEADMQTKMLTVSIDSIKYTTGSYANGDIQVCIYDVTAAKCLRTDHFIDTSPKFSADVQVETNASLELRFYLKTVKAMTLQLEGISVKPQVPSTTGAVDIKLGSLTTTINLTNMTVTSSYWQKGEFLKGVVRAQATGTPAFSTGTQVRLNLPSGMVMNLPVGGDTANVNVGKFTLLNAGSGWSKGVLRYETPTSFLLYYINVTSTSAAENLDGVTLTAPIVGGLAIGDTFDIEFEVPILGWSSNMKLSSQESGREIFTRYTKANSQTLSTATIVDFSTKVNDDTNAVTTGASWKFIAPEDGRYTIEPKIVPLFASVVAGQSAEMYLHKNGNATDLERLDQILFHGTQTNVYVALGKPTTIDLKKGDYVDIRVTNNTSGLLTTAPDARFNSISVYKLNTGSSTIAKDAKVYEFWKENTGIEITALSEDIPFSTKVDSLTGEFNGTVFTAQSDKIVSFNGMVLATVANADYLYLYKNGSFLTNVSTVDASNQRKAFAGKIKLKRGEYFSIRSSGTFNLTNDGNNHYITIEAN